MPKAKGKLRLAVLVSGGGTNLQALLDRASSGELAAEIVVVASDRSDAYGLVRAERAGIPTQVVDYGSYLARRPEKPMAEDLPISLEELDRSQKILKNPNRGERLRRLTSLVLAEQEMATLLDGYRPDYICLAGFMRLITPYFIGHFNRNGGWRILNIHPALLPAFPGQHGYEDTFGYGCKWGGITVHFVDEGEDSGPIIAQMAYPIWPGDDLENVRKRGLQLEYEIYAQCVNWLASGDVKLVRREGGSVRTVITDPAYKRILKGWVQKAFS